MMNAFTFCATNPKDLRAAADPAGPDNDQAFTCRRLQVRKVTAAWRNHCSDKRAQQVCEAIGTHIYCLARNKSGAPQHSLYAPANAKLQLFWSPRRAAP